MFEVIQKSVKLFSLKIFRLYGTICTVIFEGFKFHVWQHGTDFCDFIFKVKIITCPSFG